MRYIVGIDIGGTKTAVSWGTAQGEILVRRVLPTQDVHTTIGEVKKVIQAYLAEYGREKQQISGIGISCAGPLDLDKGILLSAPNMPGWRNVPLRDIFARGFALPVAVDNDANCAAMAEKRFGAGRAVEHLFYYTVSTGIGGGIIIAGRIYRGASFDAGEIGHTVILPKGPKCNCGKRGCLESLASGTAIAKCARRQASRDSLMLKLAGRKKDINAEIVAHAAAQGDKAAQGIYSTAAFYLGLSVTNVIQTLNPQMIVIGGGVAKAGKLLFQPLLKTVRAFTWKRPYEHCQIVPAQLQDKVADLGAISLLLGN